jgi:hypothetical protein
MYLFETPGPRVTPLQAGEVRKPCGRPKNVRHPEGDTEAENARKRKRRRPGTFKGRGHSRLSNSRKAPYTGHRLELVTFECDTDYRICGDPRSGRGRPCHVVAVR